MRRGDTPFRQSSVARDWPQTNLRWGAAAGDAEMRLKLNDLRGVVVVIYVMPCRDKWYATHGFMV